MVELSKGSEKEFEILTTIASRKRANNWYTFAYLYRSCCTIVVRTDTETRIHSPMCRRIRCLNHRHICRIAAFPVHTNDSADCMDSCPHICFDNSWSEVGSRQSSRSHYLSDCRIVSSLDIWIPNTDGFDMTKSNPGWKVDSCHRSKTETKPQNRST